MNEDSAFNSRRATWKDIRSLHLLVLGSFSVKLGISLVAKEFNQLVVALCCVSTYDKFQCHWVR